MRATLIFILVLVLQMVSTAQAKFQARSDARRILQNGVFQVTFTLTNAAGTEFRPPPFEHFDVLSGPTRSTSTTIVNGQRSTSLGYAYTLIGKHVGKFEIKPATIRAGNTRYSTNRIEIEVVEKTGATNVDGTTMPTDQEVFLRAEVDTSAIYPGQQVVVNYKLYTTVSIRSYNIISESDYSGLHYHYVQDFSMRAYDDVIDGVQYRIQTLRSVALFPSRPGTYELEPFIANVVIGVKDNRRSFFFNTRNIPKTVQTESINLAVRPLPEPAPAEFTGAVGTYQMSVQVSAMDISTDDAVTLTVQIVGTGDAKRWTVPSLDYLSEHFELYEPRLLKDESVDQRGSVIKRKTIEYSLIPRQPGTHDIEVHFVYFNPRQQTYDTLQSDTIALTVRQGSATAEYFDDSGQSTEEEVMYGVQSANRLPRRPPAFIFTPLFFSLCFFPWLFVTFVGVQERRKRDYANLDPEERKRREAKTRALALLEEAHLMIGESDQAFYEAIAQAMFAYVSGKLNLPTSEISKQNLSERMEKTGISESHREQVMVTVRKCEMVLYAGGTAEGDREVMYNQTMALISAIEEHLN